MGALTLDPSPTGKWEIAANLLVHPLDFGS